MKLGRKKENHLIVPFQMLGGSDTFNIIWLFATKEEGKKLQPF